MRSFVSCGIESATVDRFITNDTVAGESPSRSARNFKLTFLAGFTRGRCVFLGGTKCSVPHASPQGKRRTHYFCFVVSALSLSVEISFTLEVANRPQRRAEIPLFPSP